MPTVAPLRGLRYDPKHVGALSQVIAPPYDVIDAALQSSLYERHPANVIRLELNREEPGDDERSNKYTRAARFLKEWREQGVVMQEPAAAVYVYHQEFEVEGQVHVRRGVMARVRLERFGTGNIHPHEETMSGPKQDRLLLTRACRANLSQVFGLYPDPHGEVQELLDKTVAGQPPIEATDHLGVKSWMWPLTDETVVAKVGRTAGPQAGVHRRRPPPLRDGVQLPRRGGGGVGGGARGRPAARGPPGQLRAHDARGDERPGARRAAHAPAVRAAVRGQRRRARRQTGRLLHNADVVEGAGGRGGRVVEHRTRTVSQGTIGFYTAGDQAWTLARITPGGQGPDGSGRRRPRPAWRSLGVSILHRLVIGDLLGAKEIPTPGYVHLVREVVEGLGSGRYPLAALVMPASVEDIRKVSETGERMPAKSTYFYPKLASGLVFNPLE